LQLIIFDVDGTLVDSQHHIVEAQGRAFTAHGLPAPDRERALSVVGLSLNEAFTVLAGGDGPVASLTEAYKDAWTELRMRPGYQEILYSGARETIATLAARPDVLLGIATGKSARGVARLLAAQAWETTFATVQTADGHPSKPHPSMILAALAETGIDAASATMIGDTTYDIEMAVAADVRSIGVTWGYHEPEALRASGATAIADSFDALFALLDRSNNKVASRL
jgi:phosphoglycolate phosphatase